MSLKDLTSTDAIRQAMTEFDSLGHDEAIKKYDLSKAKWYFIKYGETLYDNCAVLQRAYQIQHSTLATSS